MTFPKYCMTCGAETMWGEPFDAGFDEQTGQTLTGWKLLCPNVEWYQLSHRHPSYTTPTDIQPRAYVKYTRATGGRKT